MKRTGRLALAWMACMGMLLPTPLLGATVAEPAAMPPVAPKITDIQLQEGGLLLGQVVDFNALGVAATTVSLRQMGREIAQTTTDPTGAFAFGKLRGGTYQIVAGRSQGIYRIWAPNTAPPTAQSSVLITPSGPDVRGQGPLGYWLGNPWVITGLVAAAVAIPVGIHNHRMRRMSSP
ncbi:MAG: carboxypeptidase regulatory-like domain-containing protein [Candidatus Nealsonbacteria bacterium]|nr:carboxypeptidase regulatory-like domain-containing protein [Candidatus Nealsonbacteria bacterium]